MPETITNHTKIRLQVMGIIINYSKEWLVLLFSVDEKGELRIITLCKCALTPRVFVPPLSFVYEHRSRGKPKRHHGNCTVAHQWLMPLVIRIRREDLLKIVKGSYEVAEGENIPWCLDFCWKKRRTQRDQFHKLKATSKLSFRHFHFYHSYFFQIKKKKTKWRFFLTVGWRKEGNWHTKY